MSQGNLGACQEGTGACVRGGKTSEFFRLTNEYFKIIAYVIAVKDGLSQATQYGTATDHSANVFSDRRTRDCCGSDGGEPYSHQGVRWETSSKETQSGTHRSHAPDGNPSYPQLQKYFLYGAAHVFRGRAAMCRSFRTGESARENSELTVFCAFHRCSIELCASQKPNISQGSGQLPKHAGGKAFFRRRKFMVLQGMPKRQV